MQNLRLAICGIHIESGTLNLYLSRRGDFLETRGAELLARYPFLQDDPELVNAVEWIPLVHFRAMPGGMVGAEDYASMKNEILTELSDVENIDGLFFDIHGAMTVQGLLDAECDLLEAIRGIIGNDVPVSCCQDLHGNVTPDLVSKLNYITAYRTAPHIDVLETRQRAMQALVRMLRDGVRPKRAWLGIPVLLSGEMTSTEVEPGRSLWGSLIEKIHDADVWDVSLWAGYPWADQKRAMASVVATGTDEKKLTSVVRDLAKQYWDSRKDFKFLSPVAVPEQWFSSDMNDLPRPIFLSDAGDNPTAGSAGDTTGVLSLLVNFVRMGNLKAIFASIPDAEAVLECQRAGVGAKVELSIGGKLDRIHSQPLSIQATVKCLRDDDVRFGAEAVVEVSDVSIIITEQRRPYHLRDDYVRLGIDPLETDITVVKIGYLEPELKAMAAHHVLLLSKGGVPPQIENLQYTKISQPMFPWQKDDFFCHNSPEILQ